ncbi:undecaprenyl-diphosphatase [Pseudochelatococcus lubricantis]|uniref:Undecaprenyl-diphosphatase n=1 Tax=Pseudochelatococcus lubricantis TaxID=1538102 RepID=A0ABX0UU25_9HYPH|nr:undecaprenyl-diphosphate phosphatase [Pseudochelatococcus lubricantis]NIJ56463.1 undecaprenyl-diphosphatase [Pseudochelatococcus lubricantis]
MVIGDLLEAVALGVVEGLTEFIPVSSTGHLLLLGHFIGFESNGKTFEVLVQLGSILAIMLVYFHRLFAMARDIRTDPAVQRFALGVLVAFLPAVVVGALAHGFIKNVLFDPWIVCLSLITGGLVLIMVDNVKLSPRLHDATQFPLRTCLIIGLCQCVAMIPGVSRSGATIVGAMLNGADKRAATEFSFFLAMPTMAAAFAYDLLKNYKNLDANDGLLITVGFIAAFLSGLLVVRSLLVFVARHGLGVFAWWRIIVGTAGLAGLMVFG